MLFGVCELVLCMNEPLSYCKEDMDAVILLKKMCGTNKICAKLSVPFDITKSLIFSLSAQVFFSL